MVDESPGDKKIKRFPDIVPDKITILKTQLSDLEGEVEKLMTDSKILDVELTGLKFEKEQLDKKYDDLKKEKEENEDKCASRIKELEIQLNDAKLEIKSLEEKKNSYDLALKTAYDVHKVQEEQLGTMKSIVENTRDIQQMTEEKVAELQRKINLLEEERAKFISNNEQFQQAMKEKEAMYETKLAEIFQIEKQLSAMNTMLGEKNAEIVELRKQIGDVETMKAELADAKDELEIERVKEKEMKKKDNQKNNAMKEMKQTFNTQLQQEKDKVLTLHQEANAKIAEEQAKTAAAQQMSTKLAQEKTGMEAAHARLVAELEAKKKELEDEMVKIKKTHGDNIIKDREIEEKERKIKILEDEVSSSAQTIFIQGEQRQKLQDQLDALQKELESKSAKYKAQLLKEQERMSDAMQNLRDVHSDTIHSYMDDITRSKLELPADYFLMQGNQRIYPATVPLEELDVVDQLTIGRNGIAIVRFSAPIHLLEAIKDHYLKDVVHLSEKSIIIYPNSIQPHPPPGEGLNQPATVDWIVPAKTSKGEPVPLKRFMDLLKKKRPQSEVTVEPGAENRVRWVFDVEHFSELEVVTKEDDAELGREEPSDLPMPLPPPEATKRPAPPLDSSTEKRARVVTKPGETPPGSPPAPLPGDPIDIEMSEITALLHQLQDRLPRVAPSRLPALQQDIARLAQRLRKVNTSRATVSRVAELTAKKPAVESLRRRVKDIGVAERISLAHELFFADANKGSLKDAKLKDMLVIHDVKDAIPYYMGNHMLDPTVFADPRIPVWLPNEFIRIAEVLDWIRDHPLGTPTRAMRIEYGGDMYYFNATIFTMFLLGYVDRDILAVDEGIMYEIFGVYRDFIYGSSLFNNPRMRALQTDMVSYTDQIKNPIHDTKDRLILLLFSVDKLYNVWEHEEWRPETTVI